MKKKFFLITFFILAVFVLPVCFVSANIGGGGGSTVTDYCLNNKCVDSPEPPPAGYSPCSTVGAHCCNADEEEYKQSFFYNISNPYAPLSQSSCCPFKTDTLDNNSKESQIASRIDGTKVCCPSPSAIYGPANAQECCPKNSTGYTKIYVQNPGSQNPGTVASGACCATNANGSSQVCTNPNNGVQTCCPSTTACDTKTGTCANHLMKCCMCMYSDKNGSICAKITDKNPNLWSWDNVMHYHADGLCPDGVSCSYGTNDPVPTSAEQACGMFSVNLIKACGWDSKLGCVDWMHQLCLKDQAANYNSSNPQAGKCEKFPLFVAPKDAVKKSDLVNSTIFNSSCTGISQVFDHEHGDKPQVPNGPSNCSYKLKTTIVGVVNKIPPGISLNYFQNSCFGATNMSETANCAQQILNMNGNTTSAVNISSSQAGSNEDLPSAETATVTSNSVQYSFTPCSQMGFTGTHAGLNFQNGCTSTVPPWTVHPENDDNAFVPGFCSDDITKNPVQMKCCPTKDSDYYYTWQKVDCNNPDCPGTKELSGTVTGCSTVPAGINNIPYVEGSGLLDSMAKATRADYNAKINDIKTGQCANAIKWNPGVMPSATVIMINPGNVFDPNELTPSTVVTFPLGKSNPDGSYNSMYVLYPKSGGQFCYSSNWSCVVKN